jgi:hypothetical protein
MIDELKNEVEKTLGRKVHTRGDCELLSEDLYVKTGLIVSYNTFRRLFEIIDYRKPRESTLDALSIYIGFQSFQDFTKRFSEVDTWPMWEQLYVILSDANPNEILKYLQYRRRQQDHFTIAFTIVVRELLNRNDISTLLLIFRDPLFQFRALPYDQVAQIGVLIGLHFRTLNIKETEEVLLLEPNFRDLVFKIFVDYGRLNGKYGEWIDYLSGIEGLDQETTVFISCLQIWRSLLNNKAPDAGKLKSLPNLNLEQHPILFGRLFGLKMLATKLKKNKEQLIFEMDSRLHKEPHFVTELLYEPAVQALVLGSATHEKILLEHKTKINQIQHWYHLSQVAIHRVYQVKMHISNGQFSKAKSILDAIPYGHIRHGYREFIEMYVAFFRFKIAMGMGLPLDELEQDFENRRKRLNYPILSPAYFENYFREI